MFEIWIELHAHCGGWFCPNPHCYRTNGRFQTMREADDFGRAVAGGYLYHIIYVD